MNISSLPNDYGIGKLGREARDFADWLVKAGVHYWQVLPMNPTGFGDSPYQSVSVYAGNPFFIDFEALEEEGLLRHEEYAGLDWGSNEERVDYESIGPKVTRVLSAAYERFEKTSGFNEFAEENRWWLCPYAEYMAVKKLMGDKPWYEWDTGLKMRRAYALRDIHEDICRDMGFHQFVQYLFYRQWFDLKKYANERGIEIIGDMPIYCAMDSTDVWNRPRLFDLDEDLEPVNVAGCPPDGFAPTGQLWGNPLYDWEEMKKDSYAWWLDRIRFASKMYDVVRIDHFRGFDSYYSIPAGSSTAEFGEWKKGPSADFFREVKSKLGKIRVIAEDLGFITDSVREMLRFSGFPGMKMMQFGFDPCAGSEYLPCNFESSSCVCYSGTHDSDTVIGWYRSCHDSVKSFIRGYIGAADSASDAEINRRFIHTCFTSIAETAVVQMQEVLGLGSEGRMNVPSTCGNNWCWRMKKGAATEKLAKWLHSEAALSARLN